jgi:excisionase family DNA binding protein
MSRTSSRTANLESLWSIAELLEHIPISESAVRRLVRRGVLPAIRVGRRILFRPSSIVRFLDERERGAHVPARRGRRPAA